MSTPIYLRLYRIARLIGHLIRGRAIVRRRFARIGSVKQDAHIARWSRQLLQLLRVDVRVHGAMRGNVRPYMIVANHVSWLDVFVIHSRYPGVFVAKAEIRDWPAIGALVDRVGTLFLSRGSRTHARRTNERIAGTLSAGRNVAVFPEGSTSNGTCIGHFHAALLQPAIDAGAPLLPVGLRYRTEAGEPAAAALYVDNMTFLESLWRIVTQPRLVAELHVTDAIPTVNENRRALARRSEAAIAHALDLPLVHRRTETPGGLPDAPPSVVRPIHSRYPGPAD